MVWGQDGNGSRRFTTYIGFIRLLIFWVFPWTKNTLDTSDWAFFNSCLLRWLWKSHITWWIWNWRGLISRMHTLNSTWSKFLFKWCHLLCHIYRRLLWPAILTKNDHVFILIRISSRMYAFRFHNLHRVHFNILVLNLCDAVFGWESPRSSLRIYILSTLIGYYSSSSTLLLIIQAVCKFFEKVGALTFLKIILQQWSTWLFKSVFFEV